MAACSDTRRLVTVHLGSRGSGEKKKQNVLHKLNRSFLTRPPSFGRLKGSQRRHKVGKQGGAIACTEGSAGKLMVPPALRAALLQFDPLTVFLASNVGDELLLQSHHRALQWI